MQPWREECPHPARPDSARYGAAGDITAIAEIDEPPVGGVAGKIFGIQRRQVVVVFTDIRHHGQADLLVVAHAIESYGFVFCGAQGRQDHGGENRNDGDDDEQFNQSEPRFVELV